MHTLRHYDEFRTMPSMAAFGVGEASWYSA